MTDPCVHHVEHSITTRARPDRVFAFIRDAASWPHVLGPTIHVEYLEKNGDEELLRLWALANGGIRSWRSRRRVDPDNLRIDFAQQSPAAPVACMSGTWLLVPLLSGGTAIRLTHAYGVTRDDPAALRWLSEATHHNSEAELAAIRSLVEREPGDEELTFTFEDSITMGAQAAAVYEFLWDARAWADRLSHVSRITVEEPAPDVQDMRMVTIAPDRSEHETRSIRVGRPGRWIAYKQLTRPALLAAHTGLWRTASRAGDAVEATSQHTVTLEPSRIQAVLGRGARAADAAEYVRNALSNNSRRTLEAAESWSQRSTERRAGVRTG